MSDEQTAEQSLSHHIRLVLDNDEMLYRTRCGMVAAFLRSDDAEYPHLLGDQLKEWCEGMGEVGIWAPDSQNATALFVTEVFTTALHWVDWRGIAVDYIAEHCE